MGGGEQQGDQQDNLTYHPAGGLFEEPDTVMIDPTGQLEQHLVVTTITQQDVDHLGPTQQPDATAVGGGRRDGCVHSGGRRSKRERGPSPTTEGNKGRGQPPPRRQQSIQGLEQPFVAWVTTCTTQKS